MVEKKLAPVHRLVLAAGAKIASIYLKPMPDFL